MNKFENGSSLSVVRKSEKWTVGWGFSAVCDLHCAFCYSSEVRQQSIKKEIEISQAEKFLVKNGKDIQAINFGTGEFFLSSNFPQILELCNKYAPNAQVAVTTNGSLANLSYKEFSIVKEYIHECDVSLDFASPESHDQWRGKNGTWNRAIQSIELALESGIITSIVMIGTKQTFNEKNILNLLKISEKYNVAFRVNIYMPTFGDFSFLPTFTSVFKAIELLSNWSSNIRSSDRLFGSIFGNNGFDSHSNLSCRIMPDGRFTPSTYLIKDPWLIEGTIDDILLAELLNTSSYKLYSLPPIPQKCHDCSILYKCQGGSIERRWLWANSLDEPDPLCPYFNFVTSEISSNKFNEQQRSEWKGPSIHLGYLPTIVALPPSFDTGRLI